MKIYLISILMSLWKNNHNTCTINLEKEHYMQDRANLKNDQMMMNHMSCSNASSKMIASNVNMSQKNSDARLQRLRNDEKKIADIINLLIKTSTLKKKMSKDYLWKEIALKLMCCLQLDSEEKLYMTQNAFITKNMQKLKTSVQLLSKQLQMQRNTHFSSKIMSWANMIREELSTKKQRLKKESSLLCKRREVMIKIANKEENH